MADREDKALRSPQQAQNSRQSGQQGAVQQGGTGKPRDQQARSGIGASQGQDRASRDEQHRERPSAGTADIERSSSSPDSITPGGNSEESLVQESTGAFKERP